MWRRREPSERNKLVQLLCANNTSRRYFAIGMLRPGFLRSCTPRFARNEFVERDANEGDAITDIKGGDTRSLRDPKETVAAAGAKIR